MDAQNGETDCFKTELEEMMESMEAIIARINEQESRITLLEHRLSPTELRAAEPAPGSDAKHPPVGYRLAVVGQKIARGGIVWAHGKGPWDPITNESFAFNGDTVTDSDAPIAISIPANEGDSRLAESVAIPVGWKKCCFFDHSNARAFGRTFIAPDPSIPWGEGYEAILPSEARNGGSCEFWADDTRKRWIPAERVQTWDERCRNQYAWRRRIPATTPTEPARDLSAEVERLEEWQEAGLTATMMWDVIQLMRKTLDCDGTTTPVERAERVMRTINELRDTVERMEAENAKLRKDRDQYRKELEELEAKIDGIKELVG